MAVKLRNTGKILEKLLYGDTLSVNKYVSVVKEDGSTVSELEKTPSIVDVACKVSFNTKDEASNGTIPNQVITITSIFVSLDYDISAGDLLTAVRKDPKTGKTTIYKGSAGEPNRTENHQEIELVNMKVA